MVRALSCTGSKHSKMKEGKKVSYEASSCNGDKP